REGVSLLGISDTAEKIGLRSLEVKLDVQDLKEAELPCILHWRQNHFVVLYKVKNHKYYLADPANGLVTLEENDFRRNWATDNDTGIALLLSPTHSFTRRRMKKVARYAGRSSCVT
ncbi:MAG: apxIB 1, partial [Mucilaginibacter sp.]|nr:apxIB 1 [Mucilaginibacter sp.]